MLFCQMIMIESCVVVCFLLLFVFLFKQKTAYEMRISDWSSDVCSSDLILRTAACFGTPAHIVEPCGFPFSDAALKRAGMDYAVRANVRRHPDWGAFEGWRAATAKRLVLLSTTGATPLPDFDFDQGDMLLFGSESAGVPPHVHRSEEHTSELQSLMRISYAVFCL